MNRKEISLTEENINNITEEIKAYFAGRKVSDRDVLKIGLLIEEALLRCRDKFGRQQTVSVESSAFASTSVTVRIKAQEYNPITEDDEESILSSQFIHNLLAAEGTSATYRYRGGCNEIIMTARKERRDLKIPGGTVTAAVILAVIAALITKLLPAGTALFLTDDLAAPLFSRLMGLIVMIAGPLIFISVVSGICALNDVATLSTVGLKAIKRFAVITVLLITYSVLVGFLFFPGISFTAGSAVNLSSIIEMLLELIPQDFASPFVESKSIQIIFIALITGTAILILDEKIPRLRELVSEVNQLFFTMMRFVSYLIPVIVFLSIYKAIAQNSLSDILGVWKLVASGYVIMVPFTACFVMYVCLRRKINIRQFLHDISAPAIVGFTSASGTLAMTKQFETAKTVMKIDEKLVDFWVPLSHAMFSPSVVPPLVAVAFYAGIYYGTPVSLPQILILYILVTQLSIASPKVPGGILATAAILLGQLGMPADVVGYLMVANIFVINAETGLAMIIRSAELEEFSYIIRFKDFSEGRRKQRRLK